MYHVISRHRQVLASLGAARRVGETTLLVTVDRLPIVQVRQRERERDKKRDRESERERGLPVVQVQPQSRKGVCVRARDFLC